MRQLLVALILLAALIAGVCAFLGRSATSRESRNGELVLRVEGALASTDALTAQAGWSVDDMVQAVRGALERCGINPALCTGIAPHSSERGGQTLAVSFRGIGTRDLGRWLTAVGSGSEASWPVADIRMQRSLDTAGLEVTVSFVDPEPR